MADSDFISVQTNGIQGFGFLTEFKKIKDRFHHMIYVLDNDQRIELMSTIEGSPIDRWPPSPPLQQVYKQSIGDDVALLGVGMAGKSHYSMSLVISEQGDSRIVVESACLIKTPDPDLDLRTSYRIPAAINPIEVDGKMRLNDNNRLVICVPLANSKCQRIDEHTIAIAPKSIATEKTIQWGYEIYFETQ